MRSTSHQLSRSFLNWPLIALMASLLSGCVGLVVLGAQEIAGVGLADNDRLTKPIVDGSSRREDLIANLGAPIHELNSGKVLIFGGRQRTRGLVQMMKDDKREEHRLIAIVDVDGVLREHLWVGRKLGVAPTAVQRLPPH